MGKEYSKEINLAADLKAVCDEHGNEIDITKSATIFHQFGLLYQKNSPHKISLIRSAVFFNAALTRQPLNHNFKNDLEELCLHVIDLAGTNQQKENLISISLKIKVKITKMRRELKEQLSRLNIIPVGLPLSQLQSEKIIKVNAIRKLQTKITNSFISIMNDVSNKCIGLLGKPPCEYAVVGMGSLSRQEITPYSDFEHVLVLEEGIQYLPNYKDILEYFRWFTVVFQIIIINLGETIIPSVSIPLLNNPNIPRGNWFFDCHTTRGISFDGMMLHACKFPLGRTQPTTNKPFTMELIKPVSEMAKYLQSDEDIKNGYHLADILTRTCFVSGNKNVYKDFECLAKSVLDCDIENNIKQIQSQMREDLQIYDVGRTINLSGISAKWNIKRVIYRSTTLFVSAIGRLHFIDKCSCFDIIDKMFAQKQISEKIAKELSFAIAVACETRLKVYMSKRSQDDSVGIRKFSTKDNMIIQQLCAMIGEQSLGDYFLTALKFQQCLHLNTFQSENLFEILDDKKFSILFLLDLHNLVLAEWQRYIHENNFSSDFSVCYHVAWTYIKKDNFKQALKLYSDLENYMTKVGIYSLEVKRRKAKCLYELERYREGLQFIENCLGEILSQNEQEHGIHAFGYMMILKGHCERHLGFLEKALESYLLALINLQYSFSPFRKNLQAKCYFFMGQCLFRYEKFSRAIENTSFALTICKEVNLEISFECQCNRLLGKCYMHLDQPQKALYYFERELKLLGRQVTYKQDACDSDISILLLLIQEATENQKL